MEQMDAKTLEALRGSIAKWEGIVAGIDTDRGTDNCSLCQLFHHDDCHGCPVSQATGEALCDSSPYVEWGELTLQQFLNDEDPRVTNDAERAAAQKELDFLKSLLPKEQPVSATEQQK